ncbi:MAG: hypothetical protein ABJC74_15740, partial [Gemmatimonadota bacterium]
RDAEDYPHYLSEFSKRLIAPAAVYPTTATRTLKRIYRLEERYSTGRIEPLARQGSAMALMALLAAVPHPSLPLTASERSREAAGMARVAASIELRSVHAPDRLEQLTDFAAELLKDARRG